MPFYDYECTECGDRFEVMHRMSEKGPKECKHCKGLLRRIYTPTISIPRSKGGPKHVRGSNDVKPPWSPKETKIHRGWKRRRKWKHDALGWS